MSKGIGQKIAIEFTEELSGNVGEKSIKQYVRPDGTPSASNTVGGYPVTNAFDGNPNSFWYNYWGGSSQWIQIRLLEIANISGFRWNNVLNNRPKSFKLQGSANGSTWVDLFTAESQNADGWQSFEFGNSFRYEYLRWTFTSYYNSYIQLAELELQMLVGNEVAFKLMGQQPKYINGPLTAMDYKIKSVEAHPTRLKTLLLTTYPQSRFATVAGNLTIAYDAIKGNLSGRGGAVKSFTTVFLPTELIPEPNPNAEETVTVCPTQVIAAFIPITYANGYGRENIAVAPVQPTVVLTYVGIINP